MTHIAEIQQNIFLRLEINDSKEKLFVGILEANFGLLFYEYIVNFFLR